MKAIFTYFILSAFLLNAGGKVIIYLDFLINQDYITQNLCENKDKPVLKCNGKCQLARELAKEEKKEKKETKHKFEDTNTYFFCSFDELIELEPVFYQKREHSNAKVQSRSTGFLTKVFHPPALS